MLRFGFLLCVFAFIPLAANAQDEKVTPGQAHLRQLDVLIGTWERTTSNGETERATCEWINNKSYIQFTVGDFREIIGWDLKQSAITSWGFGSHGGQGKADWVKEGDVWKVSVNWLNRWGKEVPVWRTIKVDGDTMEVTWSYGGHKTAFQSKRVDE